VFLDPAGMAETVVENGLKVNNSLIAVVLHD